jgi:hypothetical protein
MKIFTDRASIMAITKLLKQGPGMWIPMPDPEPDDVCSACGSPLEAFYVEKDALISHLRCPRLCIIADLLH